MPRRLTRAVKSKGAIGVRGVVQLGDLPRTCP